jgi:predicted dehydrogenase
MACATLLTRMPGSAMMKTRYVQVGLGHRSEMYHEALLTRYADHSELVGFCDSNEGRLALRVAWARECGVDVPGYLDSDFDRMIRETRPDCVIVTTQDSFHDEYICRAMELGCDVISEKPLTVDADKCQRIIDTQRRTGKNCRVTFNYRYSPHRTQVKDMLMSGVIGEVLSVDFHWLLDTRHGADYFRRWHRHKKNSGGLMVHKATHHFDLVNWWLDSIPESVFASGHRRFYTPEQAETFGLHNRSERCLDCPEQAKCPFFLDISQYEKLRSLYLNNEQYDGYYRDRCVFSRDIDIEDSMNVVVNYASGAKMSYSLNAYMPWEGYMITFNGSKGRLEHKCQESVYISGDGSVPGALKKDGTTIHVFPHFKPAYAVDVWMGKGGHGGGDVVLLDDIFSPDAPEDPYHRAADHRSGAYSILTGIAANQSMATGTLVNIADLVHGL